MFYTRDPEQIKEWYPESDVGSYRGLFEKYGLNVDRYSGKKAAYDQAFDTLKLLRREAGD